MHITQPFKVAPSGCLEGGIRLRGKGLLTWEKLKNMIGRKEACKPDFGHSYSDKHAKHSEKWED